MRQFFSTLALALVLICLACICAPYGWAYAAEVSHATSSEEQKFPTLTGRVVDEAGVLSAPTRQQLDQMLSAQESATTDQVVVVTLKSLDGVSIEDYGYQLGRKWAIGQKDKNNGVLLIVAPNERKVRIEVGYGLEGTVTDAISSEIINQVILPSFKAGDMNAGIINGTRSILAVLNGTNLSASNTSIATGAQTRVPADARASQPVSTRAEISDNIATILFLLVFFFCFIRACSRPTTGSWGSSGGYLGGGGFGGGGGFSGGGGSFGGGGASGGW